jgi:hypothetical protein
MIRNKRSPILNLQEGNQLDLSKDISSIEIWNENIYLFTNSKLLSDKQEEDNGEWLFSPNIRRTKAEKNLNLDKIENGLVKNDMIRVISPEQTLQKKRILKMLENTKRRRNYTENTETGQKIAFSPVKNLNYQPKLFNPMAEETTLSKKTNEKKHTSKTTAPRITRHKICSSKSLTTPLSNRYPIKGLRTVAIPEGYYMDTPRIKENNFNSSMESKDWKLMQWRRDQLKEKANIQKALVATPAKKQKNRTKINDTKRKHKVHQTSDISDIANPKQKRQNSLATMREYRKECAIESTVITHSIVEEIIDEAMMLARQPWIEQEGVILFGIMDTIPEELCRNAKPYSVFSFMVDVEIFDEENSKAPVYLERSLVAHMELVDKSKCSRSKDNNISAENIHSEEEDTSPLINAYYYIRIGVSLPLPDMLFEKVIPISPSKSKIKVKPLLKKNFWYTIKPEMDEFELVSKVFFSKKQMEMIPLLEEFEKSRVNVNSDMVSMHNLFEELLNQAQLSIFPSYSEIVKGNGNNTTLSHSPFVNPDGIMVDISEKEMTPYRTPKATFPKRNENKYQIGTPGNTFMSSHTVSRTPKSSQASSNNTSLIKRFWKKIKRGICL